MATQNPIDYEGTYPLPEAQLDRFLVKIKMGYPELEEEVEVLNRAQKKPPIQELESVISLEDVRELQTKIKEVFVEDSIKHYIVSLADRTRVHESIYLGVSPRGSIALMKACQAYAFMNGRDYCIPDDVQYLAPYVFTHRIILKAEAKYEGLLPEDVIDRIISRVPVPVQRYV